MITVCSRIFTWWWRESEEEDDPSSCCSSTWSEKNTFIVSCLSVSHWLLGHSAAHQLSVLIRDARELLTYPGSGGGEKKYRFESCPLVIEEESDAREGKGRCCCLEDELEYRTSHLEARMICRKVFGWTSISGGRGFGLVWCEPDDH